METLSGLVVAAAVTLTGATTRALQTHAGVCYNPWFHPLITKEVLSIDMALIAKYFQAVRTYSARWGEYCAVDIAAAASLRIAVGVNMDDRSRIQEEITAVCESYSRHPWAVEAVYVGNENLKHGDFGRYSVGELARYIAQVKQCVGNTPVGTSQRINEWLSAPGAKELAGASDIIGFTVYPWFTPGHQPSLSKLNDQYNQMVALYGPEKLHITETGYPHCGESAFGNVASIQAMTDYFWGFYRDFIPGKNREYWFMMFDLPASNPGAGYEKCFGLFDTNRVQNILALP
ncbi:hypothetical protein PsorP6_017664 [Peronosclerospora sorghi]|uniref:Uncharacterized protein n=1 Tax=Peronosclerospora sorghi TaxID=230839 RepID=A0ACC0WM96_9STRA|nr:hypothetical protein PsorP6_017664 [Peronosclerospora sorghi]